MNKAIKHTNSLLGKCTLIMPILMFLCLSDYTWSQSPTENQGQNNTNFYGTNVAANTDSIRVKATKTLPYGAEKMPSFPGGEDALINFISENLKYPRQAVVNGIQGHVTIRFIVEETGAISDVSVFQSLDPDCDKEAIRVIKLMPKWTPGMNKGVNVSVYYLIPIRFKIRN